MTHVRTEAPYRLVLEFTDGSNGVADLSSWIIDRRGVFTPLHDPGYFALASVDPEAGTVTWPNGVDLDPDVLYAEAHGRTI